MEGHPCVHDEHSPECYTDELICGYKECFLFPAGCRIKGRFRCEGDQASRPCGPVRRGLCGAVLYRPIPLYGKGPFTIGTCPYGVGYYSSSDLFWLKQIKWMFKCFPDRLLHASIAKLCSVTPAGRRIVPPHVPGFCRLHPRNSKSENSLPRLPDGGGSRQSRKSEGVQRAVA